LRFSTPPPLACELIRARCFRRLCIPQVDSHRDAHVSHTRASSGTSSTTQHTDSISEGGGESAGAASADDQVGML
jgi:hypothetical protein